MYLFRKIEKYRDFRLIVKRTDRHSDRDVPYPFEQYQNMELKRKLTLHAQAVYSKLG